MQHGLLYFITNPWFVTYKHSGRQVTIVVATIFAVMHFMLLNGITLDMLVTVSSSLCRGDKTIGSNKETTTQCVADPYVLYHSHLLSQ